MMTSDEFREHLEQLGISAIETAQLLDVGLRTLRRWSAPADPLDPPEPIPGPVEAALRAWLKLHRLGLAWRPNSQSLQVHDAIEGAVHMANVKLVTDACERVQARHGPAAIWEVDVERGRAILGPLQIFFHRYRNGMFAPQSYARRQGSTDIKRDRQLIDDAYQCILDKLAKQPAAERPRFTFDEPEASMAWDDVIVMVDHSVSPQVLVRIWMPALREVLGDRSLGDEACEMVVRASKSLFVEIVEQAIEQKHVDEDYLPECLVVDIGAEDLIPYADKLASPKSADFLAALRKLKGSTL